MKLLRKKNHQPQPATQERKPEDLAPNWAREFRAEYEREQAARPSPHQQWEGLFQRGA
jgi:hypothetical protein